MPKLWHRLYGMRSVTEPGDAAWWRRAALEAMAEVERPILCGGVGAHGRRPPNAVDLRIYDPDPNNNCYSSPDPAYTCIDAGP